MKRTLLLLIPFLVLSGCGSGTPAQPEPIASDQQVQNMVQARAIFNASADKNYDGLAADKKAEYAKLVGAKDDADARRWWNNMASPTGISGGPSSGER